MMRFVLCLIVLATMQAGTVHAADDAMSLFGGREIVCVVEFSPNSNTLNRTSQEALKAVLPRLDSIDTNSQMIRIEGFALPNEGAGTILAFDRALAVDELLRLRHGNRNDRSLTGIIANAKSAASDRTPYRAEIVVYDNLFATVGDPANIQSKEIR